jgi:hypothetical protein
MLLMFFSESRSNGYDTQQQPPGAVCGETLRAIISLRANLLSPSLIVNAIE